MIEIFVGLLSTFLTSEIDNYNFKIVNDNNYKELELVKFDEENLLYKSENSNFVFARFGIGEVEEIDLENGRIKIKNYKNFDKFDEYRKDYNEYTKKRYELSLMTLEKINSAKAIYLRTWPNYLNENYESALKAAPDSKDIILNQEEIDEWRLREKQILDEEFENFKEKIKDLKVGDKIIFDNSLSLDTNFVGSMPVSYYQNYLDKMSNDNVEILVEKIVSYTCNNNKVVLNGGFKDYSGFIDSYNTYSAQALKRVLNDSGICN